MEIFVTVNLMTYFAIMKCHHENYVIKWLLKFCVIVNFTAINWPNHATSDHWGKKIKLSDILSFFLSFDLVKGGASVLLAPF